VGGEESIPFFPSEWTTRKEGYKTPDQVLLRVHLRASTTLLLERGGEVQLLIEGKILDRGKGGGALGSRQEETTGAGTDGGMSSQGTKEKDSTKIRCSEKGWFGCSASKVHPRGEEKKEAPSR